MSLSRVLYQWERAPSMAMCLATEGISCDAVLFINAHLRQHTLMISTCPRQKPQIMDDHVQVLTAVFP